MRSKFTLEPAMEELIVISQDAIPAALERAEHYRLLNEPEEAESICRDVLAVEENNQRALVLLLLALTDQLPLGSPTIVERAREVLERLDGEYERAYYAGLICERQAKVLLRMRGRRCGFVAYQWFQDALNRYRKAMELRQEGNDEAVLRFNTCVRIIERHPHCAPEPEEQVHFGIE